MQQEINLLDLVGIPLEHASNTKGGEYKGACPFCGGVDRFWVHPAQGRWYCRQCNMRGGDAIDFVRLRDQCSYREAVKILGLPHTPRTPIPYQAARNTLKQTDRDKPAITNPDWQKAARQFHSQTMDALDGKAGKLARDYLVGRGIVDYRLAEFGLGYNPKEYRAVWGGIEVWLPKGIVIPWGYDPLLTIRVRPIKPWTDQKYFQPKGCFMGGYYRPRWVFKSSAEWITPKHVAIITEGEFDAMALAMLEKWRAIIRPIALGGSNGGRNLSNVVSLGTAQKVLIMTDTDQAGEQCAEWWLGELPNAIRLRPVRKDASETMMLDGLQGLSDLVGRAL